MEMNGQNKIFFRPLVRTSANVGNQFVRLSPRTAEYLRDVAVKRSVTTSGPRLNNDSDAGHWSIVDSFASSSACESGIEFLPLAITANNGKTVYASYNGGDLDYVTHGMSIEEGTSNLLRARYLIIVCSLFAFHVVAFEPFFPKPMIESVICHYR